MSKMIRRCKCGHSNQVDAKKCEVCERRLRNQLIVDAASLQTEAKNSDESQQEPRDTSRIHMLRLLTEDRRVLEAKDGDIIGRNAVGSDYLQDFPTVSRKHIQVFRQKGTWWIKNLSETNETWVNSKLVSQNEEWEITESDELKLSSKCCLSVM